MVKDLSAERVGNRVLLRWTTPSKTTDGLDMLGGMKAEICRSAGQQPTATKKSLAACVNVQSVAAVAGASTAFDDLPPDILADPVSLLIYRIQILNAAGRSAGRSSTAAYAAGGVAPQPVEALTAAASESGAVLQWKRAGSGQSFPVDLARTDLAPAAPVHKANTPVVPSVHHAKPNRAGKQPDPAVGDEVHLRAPAAGKPGNSAAGTVDTTAKLGETYSYVAQQIRTAQIDGHTLEIRSVPSPAVVVVMRDSFPPKSPSGLATIPGASEAAHGTPSVAYIDLSWEPNTESDLAGYFVYRQLARANGDPEGPLGKLTPLPIAAPAYRDVAVAPGQRYIYSITAVDASGNESAPSAKAQEVAAGQNVGPPQ